MKAFVTGGAGFIGSTLADRLLAGGHQVTAYDNFSSGQRGFVAHNLVHPAYRLIEGDLLDERRLADAVPGHDVVFHLAANADVRHGLEHPRRDLEQNTIATYNVLESMRLGSVRRIVFSSTGSIYGEPDVFPTPENCPFPVQTSLYGASKLAGEGLVSAYCTGYGFSGWVFRFVSILGERYTHGHVFDFVRQLRADPANLRILGDGKQRKSYLYVQDCVDAMMLALEERPHGYQVLNLGTDEYVSVEESVSLITRVMGVKPRLSYTGGARGWVGDSPFIFLDCAKIRALGWMPRLRIAGAIERTTKYLLDNPSLLDRRS